MLYNCLIPTHEQNEFKHNKGVRKRKETKWNTWSQQNSKQFCQSYNPKEKSIDKQIKVYGCNKKVTTFVNTTAKLLKKKIKTK